MKNLVCWIGAAALICGIVAIASGAEDEGALPDLDGAVAWLNSAPLSSKSLRGKVVLVKVPGNGKPFPDGSKIAKIEWKPKKSTEAPFSVRVPDVLQDVFLIEKDSKRFPDTKGWAYAVFDYVPPSDTFKPNATGVVSCGFTCHTAVAAKDYIFTAYGKR